VTAALVDNKHWAMGLTIIKVSGALTVC